MQALHGVTLGAACLRPLCPRLEPCLTPSESILLELHELLQQRAQALGRAVVGGAWAGLCAGLALAVALAHHGAVQTAVGLAKSATIGGLCVAVGGGLYNRWRLRRPTPGATQQAAQMAARLVPELGSALASAITLTPRLAAELGQAVAPPSAPTGHSLALAAEHLRRTASTLRAAELAQRWQAQHSRWLYAVGCAAGAASLLLVICVFSCPAGRQRLWHAVVDPAALRQSDLPLTTDLEVTYTYPAYTQLAPRQVHGSDGSLQAVVGTEVRLQARAEMPIAAAWLQLQLDASPEPVEVAASAIDAATMHFILPLLHDGTYRFVVRQKSGERLADAQAHTLRAVADRAPKATLIRPTADVQLRDNQSVTLQWHAEDDFGLGSVELVIERPGVAPHTIALWAHDDKAPAAFTASGTYSWAAASLGLTAGQFATFHIAATDRDSHLGPKVGVSVARRLTVFSARAHHEDVLAKLRATLDTLVDALGFELEEPLTNLAGDASPLWPRATQGIDAAAQRTAATHVAMQQAVAAVRDDKLAQPQVRAAFNNVQQNVQAMAEARRQEAVLLNEVPAAARHIRLAASVALQRRYIAHLERDIVYLDDLLAVSRIHELQALTKDLLANQRDLKDLLTQFQNSQNPELKTQLQQGIATLREQMRDVLRKMSEIKKALPGEYRNMEASTMLRLDDQLQRIDKQLSQGDLAGAAQELEQLANMVENMAQSLDSAQKQYGGERYDAMRAQLQSFAQAFEELDHAQEEVSQHSAALVAQYRQQAMAKVAKNMHAFVQKARRLAHDGLNQLDDMGQNKQVAGALDREMEQARQGLLDLDSLLAHEDLAEAHRIAGDAQQSVEQLVARLPTAADKSRRDSSVGLSATRRAGQTAAQRAAAIEAMLDQLFADADQVLKPQQQQQMAALGDKQAALAKKAQSLGERMAQMAEQMPLFGGMPQRTLQEAQQHMQAAATDLRNQAPAPGAGHSQQATDKLNQLRQTLKEAAKQGSGQGMPLPLGPPASGHGTGTGQFDDTHQEEVTLPAADRGKAGPTFRQDLLEAAKQQAPAYYEDAVRRYYNELMR